jgi:hypothetical protein
MYAMEHSGLRQSRSAFRTYAAGVLLVLLATVLRTVTSVTSNLISANVSVGALCVDALVLRIAAGSALVANFFSLFTSSMFFACFVRYWSLALPFVFYAYLNLSSCSLLFHLFLTSPAPSASFTHTHSTCTIA